MAFSSPIDNSEGEVNHYEEWTSNAGSEERSVLTATGDRCEL